MNSLAVGCALPSLDAAFTHDFHIRIDSCGEEAANATDSDFRVERCRPDPGLSLGEIAQLVVAWIGIKIQGVDFHLGLVFVKSLKVTRSLQVVSVNHSVLSNLSLELST